MIPDINLLPKVEKRATNSPALWVIVILIALMFIAFGIYYGLLKSNISSLESQQQALSSEMENYKKQMTSVNNQSQDSFDQSVKFVESVSYPVTPVIDSIEGHLESYEKLTNITYGEAGVTITVDFETLNGVSLYVQKLLTDPLYTDVQVESVTSFEPDKKEYQDATPSDLLVPRYTASIKLTLNQANLLAEVKRP